MTLIPVILSGGSGTRLWPVSRESQPKPFMAIAGRTLLRRTFERACRLPGVDHVAVVTNMAYSYKTAEELASADGEQAASLLLEPNGRNTAPAVALAALWARARFGPEAVLVVLPADHLIEKDAEFHDAVRRAAELATREPTLVLFGITPSGPEPGFGYIEWGAPLGETTAHTVKRFVEKPSSAKALEYVRAGNFAWNSGMFCFTAKTILDAFDKHARDVLAAAQTVIDKTDLSKPQVQFDAEAFAGLPDISIDYAVMERAANVAVIPCDFGWNDIGSWKAVAEVAASDEKGNTVEGNAILVDARRSYIRAGDRLVAAVGVEDLVIIDTPDAVLVSHKDSTQRVKDIVANLKLGGRSEAKEHLTVERPWGWYTVIHEAPGYKVKRVEVKPGQKLSLQLHNRRSEHWIVTEGVARLTIGDETLDVSAKRSAYVPVGVKHRIENATDAPVVIVEVQCGDYLGEDDIVRFSDVYGRV